MDKLSTSNLKLGIIAGGQLAKMLIQEASKWDIITYVMDHEEKCPAASIASHFTKGSRFDFDDVYNFGKKVDILTFEIESINTDALKKLKSEGHEIVPDPGILELIQDKGLQKKFYKDNDIPTSEYRTFDNQDEIKAAIEKGELKYPFVQKLRKGGYDGRGVAVVKDEHDLDDLLEGPSIVEDKIDIAKEIAVIAARNKKGEIKCFPVVEMIFDPRANLVDNLICPADITAEQSEKAQRLASQIIASLEMEGLLAIELFVDTNGNVLVNEMAPRTHNSGHHTIESVMTSQFEQHLRSILNLPLGSVELRSPAVMVNILGSQGYEGPVRYEGLQECLAMDGVKIHLYGKKITRPFRKMGHVTVVSSTLKEAMEKADKVTQLIKVLS
jgi:5-(carboxyamino)imidazole ribonucleotide synthase